MGFEPNGGFVFAYGILGISVSAGLPPFSIVNVQTPIGTVTTNDHQYGGGLIIAFLGIVLMALAASNSDRTSIEKL